MIIQKDFLWEKNYRLRVLIVACCVQKWRSILNRAKNLRLEKNWGVIYAVPRQNQLHLSHYQPLPRSVTLSLSSPSPSSFCSQSQVIQSFLWDHVFQTFCHPLCPFLLAVFCWFMLQQDNILDRTTSYPCLYCHSIKQRTACMFSTFQNYIYIF